MNPPSGYVFRTRCPQVQERCAQNIPTLTDTDVGSRAACLRTAA